MFSHWADYLSAADLQTVTEFVEHSKSGDRVPYCLVFRGPGGTGKTQLCKEIEDIVGIDQCCYLSGRISAELSIACERALAIYPEPCQFPTAQVKLLLADEVSHRRLLSDETEFIKPKCNVLVVSNADVPADLPSRTVYFIHAFKSATRPSY